MFTTKKIASASATALLALGMTGGLVAPTYAAESGSSATSGQSAQQDAGISAKKIDENTVKLSSDTYTFYKEGNIVKAKDSNGNVKDLPKQTTGAGGKTLTMKYFLEDNGDLKVVAVDMSSPASSTSKPGASTADINDDMKCWGSVFGTAGGTAVTAASVGIAFGPQGALGGALLGSIFGGVQGMQNC